MVRAIKLWGSAQHDLHDHNLVSHETALPCSQGWSPMIWKILQRGQSHPATLFEAVVELDAGLVYLQWQIHPQASEQLEKVDRSAAPSSPGALLEWTGLISRGRCRCPGSTWSS